MNAILDIVGLSKRFGSVVALDHLDLQLQPGQVLGLVGQNGSGKSTLMKVLAGLQAPDSGELRLRGQPVKIKSAATATRLGIGMVHQEQSLVPNLTVAENIFLDKPDASKRFGLYRWSRLFAAAQEQLDKIGVKIRPDAIVDDLSFVQRQQVELAKVLAIEELVDHPPIILFDEPTSVLTPDEIAVLFREIERLRERASIVFISHRLDEVLGISDRVLVMTNGVKVADRPVADLDREELYSLMVGRERAAPVARRAPPATPATPRLQLSRFGAAKRFQGIDLSVAPGEIVGLVGVLGSGAEELCRAIFGAETGLTGTVTLNGKVIDSENPREAVESGIAYLPSNRRFEGMLAGRTLNQNMALTYGLEYGRGGVLIDHAAEAREVDKWLARLKVKATSSRDPIERLSGGNQQKVVLGKWLMSKKLQVLLLDHPTRGLDPGARDDLFGAIRDQAAAGLAIIFVADTSEEVLELADRVVVLKDGGVTATFDLRTGELPAQEDIVKAMV